MMDARVLLAGGAGYVGSALAGRLLSDTDCKVTVLDRLHYGGDSLLPYFRYGGRFDFVRGDIRDCDLDGLGRFDFVINLAALVGEPVCRLYPRDAREINHAANTRLARHFASGGACRFIFSSTCSNYGTRAGTVSETDPLDPISLYSRTKASSEEAVLGGLPGLPAAVLRFATAYGMAPRIRFDLLLHQFIRDAWENHTIRVFGGDSWRPMVHVDDIARAVVLVMERDGSLERKDVLNIGSDDQNYQKIQLARMVSERLGADIEDVRSEGDPRNYRVSFAKAQDVLGYRTAWRPGDAINHIAAGLEAGLIDGRILHESANLPGADRGPH